LGGRFFVSSWQFDLDTFYYNFGQTDLTKNNKDDSVLSGVVTVRKFLSKSTIGLRYEQSRAEQSKVKIAEVDFQTTNGHTLFYEHHFSKTFMGYINNNYYKNDFESATSHDTSTFSIALGVRAAFWL